MEHQNEELLAALYQQYLSETIKLKEQIAALQLTVQKLEDQQSDSGDGNDATEE